MTSILSCLIFLSSISVHAEFVQTINAPVSKKTQGGSVLMLQMKELLVIDGETQKKLDKELGEAGRKHFFDDMVMNESVQKIKADYSFEDRPVTNELVRRYEKLVSKSDHVSMQ